MMRAALRVLGYFVYGVSLVAVAAVSGLLVLAILVL